MRFHYSFLKRRNVGIPPYTQTFNYLLFIQYSLFFQKFSAPCGTDGSSGRRPLRFLWIRAKLAVRRISLLPSQKYHIASAIYHTHLRISLVWVGADIIRPNAYVFINPQSRYARQLLFKGAKGQAILYKNRSEATLNYALRIANYTLYNRVRAEPFLNFSLFIIHFSLKVKRSLPKKTPFT